MKVVAEVFAELWSMFVGDRRLTIAAIAVVGVAALAAKALSAPAPVAGAILTVGALAVLADSVLHAARRARA